MTNELKPGTPVAPGALAMRPTVCPHCGHGVNAGGRLHGEVEMPQPGDWTVCLHCAKPSVFTEEMEMRKPTVPEIVQAAGDRELWDTIRRVRAMIKSTS